MYVCSRLFVTSKLSIVALWIVRIHWFFFSNCPLIEWFRSFMESMLEVPRKGDAEFEN